jgi:hypothetical protein
MANSAGGQIIYGIGEDKKSHKPSSVDDGVTDDKTTREWLHQIIGSNIHPRIDGLKVQRIGLSANSFGFVITVLPTQGGPHQAPDKKYYKRYELEAVPMDDYEIRDIMRRSTTPDLQIWLDFGGKDKLMTEFAAGELSKSFFLSCTVSNRSAAPAYHAIIDILVDAELTNPFQVNPFTQTTMIARTPSRNFKVFRRTISSPPDVPIFQEAVHETHIGQIALQMPIELRASSIIYLETKIQAPGFSKHEEWAIMCKGGLLTLLHPGHPMLR